MRPDVRVSGYDLTVPEWSPYKRPEGRTWRMNPARRVIYENPDAQAQGDWKAGQIMEMLRRRNLFPKDLCEVGVLSKPVVERLENKLEGPARVWGHEVPLQELELNDCRADPVLRAFLHDITVQHPAAR